MSIRLCSIAAIGLGLLCSRTVIGEDQKPEHVWSYSGSLGPNYWGDLKPEFAACKNGHRQSPIDIRSPQQADLPAIDEHLRLLVALPLLIVAELIAHRRMRMVVRQFLGLGLIPDAARARFDSAVASAMRLRNSGAAELLLIALVYGMGVLYVWRNYVALNGSSWYGAVLAGELHPSLAGWWLGCVSLPIFQFLLLRWYFRLFIWARFLWQVSDIDLRLLPTHPDRCGGLGFLMFVRIAFAPLLLAQGVLLSGVIANRILFAGARLSEFKGDLIAIVLSMVLVVLAPLLVFSRKLEEVSRTGVSGYGILAQRYAREFD